MPWQLLYVELALKTFQKLQLVQSAATSVRIVAGHRDHITSVVFLLHWLQICFQAQFKVLELTFKVLYGLGPTNLLGTTYFLGTIYTFSPLNLPSYSSHPEKPCFSGPCHLMLAWWQYEKQPPPLWLQNSGTPSLGRLIYLPSNRHLSPAIEEFCVSSGTPQ